MGDFLLKWLEVFFLLDEGVKDKLKGKRKSKWFSLFFVFVDWFFFLFLLLFMCKFMVIGIVYVEVWKEKERCKWVWMSDVEDDDKVFKKKDRE